MNAKEQLDIANLPAQERYQRQQDDAAVEWGFALLELDALVRRWGKQAVANALAELPEQPASRWQDWQPSCPECENWRCARTLKLSDGTPYRADGFCEVRAAAALAQMPLDYACLCPFFTLDIPF